MEHEIIKKEWLTRYGKRRASLTYIRKHLALEEFSYLPSGMIYRKSFMFENIVCELKLVIGHTHSSHQYNMCDKQINIHGKANDFTVRFDKIQVSKKEQKNKCIIRCGKTPDIEYELILTGKLSKITAVNADKISEKKKQLKKSFKERKFKDKKKLRKQKAIQKVMAAEILRRRYEDYPVTHNMFGYHGGSGGKGGSNTHYSNSSFGAYRPFGGGTFRPK